MKFAYKEGVSHCAGVSVVKLMDALNLDSLRRATVVAGTQALERTVRWVNVVDVPDPLPWVREGDLLLTTGYAWPRDEDGLDRLIAAMAGRGLAGLGLAVPNFFERMPLAARRAADAHHLPLLEIPWEIPFSSITEEIHRSILSLQRDLLEQSEAIHKKLMKAGLEAKSLQDLTDTLHSLIGREVWIEHPEGGVLAKSPAGGKPDLSENGQSEHAPYECPILIKREPAAVLKIVQHGHPLGELEIRAAESAAVVIALHLSQQRALASLETQLGYSFLESLLEGVVEPTSQMLQRAQILGFDPGGVYSVGLLVLSAQVPLSRDGVIRREKLAVSLKRELQDLHAAPLLSLSQNHITFLLPERCPFSRLWERLRSPDVAMFLSRTHQGFAGVRQGFAEVSSLLPYTVPGRCCRFEDLLVHRVLIGEREARAQFLEKLFQPLMRDKNGEVLVETVIAAARCGFHLKKAAEAMCVHPKTLRYRLDRAISLGGFDFQDPQQQFELQLAERVLSLQDK
ncbi:PucR family transcriptional regulator [Cohnella pontilimi]|uniref:PucR family transcriptional regulator n=1 Tax=Cohnella pontilimi TaxID=2564100 RepID=A0A4U0FE70_9BACL|nr:PucR family transcriptional regulator [Cohnella pontilimi]TJY41562.1 PucR family transcriptional regulator [Cohnella pontilimi]